MELESDTNLPLPPLPIIYTYVNEAGITVKVIQPGYAEGYTPTGSMINSKGRSHAPDN